MNSSNVSIRTAKPEDAPVAGKICYDAFLKITGDHAFPPYVPSPDAFIGLFTRLFAHPGVYTVIAEADGKIIGSNAMDERSPIAGIGPITVDPTTQNRGVGRKLMAAVIDRARARNFAGGRLWQAAHHNPSPPPDPPLALDPRDPPP